MNRLLVALLVGLSIGGTAESLSAQEAAQGAVGSTSAVSQADEQGFTSGLPERAAAPRTMRAYWHVFGAFAATWILLFGYAISLGRRFGRMEEEVRQVRGAS